MPPVCLVISHNDGGTNHRLDHATSRDSTIRLKALPHDDQTETRRAWRSAGKVYTLDFEESVNLASPNRAGVRIEAPSLGRQVIGQLSNSSSTGGLVVHNVV